MLHICPESDCSREILPHSFIFPDTFLTFVNKRLQSVFFDLILSVQSQKFLYFQLYRQTVGIPAGFTVYLKSLHGLIAADRILQRSGHYVMDARLSVGRWRSLVKDEFRLSFSCCNALVQQVLFFPFFDLLVLYLRHRLF